MIQIVPQDRGLGAFAGEGLSKGFTEAFPKEIERLRLSSALKDLANFQGTPAEQLAQAASAPGMTPQLLQELLPLMRQERQRRGRQGAEAPSREELKDTPLSEIPREYNPVESGQEPTSTYDFGDQEETPGRLAGLVTREAEEAARQPIIRKTDDQLLDEAFALVDREGILLPEAKQRVRANEDARIANQEEIRGLKDRQTAQQRSIYNQIKEQLDKKIQSLGVKDFTELPGELQQRLAERAYFNVATGLTESEAVQQATNLGLDLAKDINTIRNKISTRPFFGKESQELLRDVKTASKTFQDAGEEEYLSKDLQTSLDIGPKTAAYLAYKPSKEQQDKIFSYTKEDNPEKIATDIIKSLKPNQSLDAIGYMLSEAGLNDGQVMNYVNLFADQGQGKLTVRQRRELSEYTPVESTLNNMWFSSVFNPTGETAKFLIEAFEEVTGQRKPKVSTIEKIKRKFGKK